MKTLDRGHMCPAGSNECLGDQVLTECFYFSNMAPQYHNCNAGDWEGLEKYTRQLASNGDIINIWAGSSLQYDVVKDLNVPRYCWKVFYSTNQKQYHYYVFANTTDLGNGFQNHEVKKDSLEHFTGFKF